MAGPVLGALLLVLLVLLGGFCLGRVLPKNYQHIVALDFAVKEINENSQILPNVTLGFQIYDNYYNVMWTYYSTMLLISSLERFSPNYNCDLRNKLTAVIGSLDSQFSSDMAIFLDMHKIPQTQPISECVERCRPGSSKKVKEGEPFCCYDCISCPEGKISHEVLCLKITSTSWPSHLQYGR